MFNAHVIDCEFPLDVGATVEEDGKVVESSTFQGHHYRSNSLTNYRVSSLAMALSIHARCAAQTHGELVLRSPDQVLGSHEA